MTEVSAGYLMRAELWLAITILAYFLMNGAQIYETVVLVPKWSAAPPESFQYFKQPYGLDLKTFWIVAHSIHEITFIAAIVFCWQLSFVRNGLLLIFVIHFAVRLWTIGYFAPNIINFQNIANGGGNSANLLASVSHWRNLNYLRVGIFIALSFALIPLCIRVMMLVKQYA